MTHRKDKNTIINRMVYDTSDIMEAKAEEEEMIADMLEEEEMIADMLEEEEMIADMLEENKNPGAEDTIRILRARAIEIRKAVKLIRDNEGCWN